MKLVQRAAESKTLADFDLSSEDLTRIVSDAHAERARLGKNNFPKNAAGLTFYFHIIAGLRKHLTRAGTGWNERTIRGLEFVEHEGKRLRIGYLSADEGTGHGGATLRSRRRRGRASQVVAAQNMQQCLNLPREFLTGQPAREGDIQSWFLAVFRGDTAYRLELALPITCEDGWLVGWAQRLLLEEIPLGSEPKLDGVGGFAPAEAPRPIARRRRPKVQDPAPTGSQVVGGDRK